MKIKFREEKVNWNLNQMRQYHHEFKLNKQEVPTQACYFLIQNKVKGMVGSEIERLYLWQ